MRRVVIPLVVLAAASACHGHPQAEGPYRLTLGAVQRDDCGLAARPEVTERLSLRVDGEVVHAEYSLFGLAMAGEFQEGPLLYPTERFYLDGSASNVDTPVGNTACLVDMASAHVDAATKNASAFSGNLVVRLDTRHPDECNCQLWADLEGRAP